MFEVSIDNVAQCRRVDNYQAWSQAAVEAAVVDNARVLALAGAAEHIAAGAPLYHPGMRDATMLTVNPSIVTPRICGCSRRTDTNVCIRRASTDTSPWYTWNWHSESRCDWSCL